MANFFHEMSHGKLDLSGSQIFPYKDGWFTLTHTFKELNKKYEDWIKWSADKKGPEPQKSTFTFRIWAEEAATWYHPDRKVDLTKFSGVVAVATVGHVGYVGWPGEMHAICDEFSVKPSVIAQEMGHGYGLRHSMLHGSLDEYMDEYDIMSTRSAFSARHTDYDSIHDPAYKDVNISIGPGLNAANMDGRGWLDYSRVRRITYGNETVDLRPLHRFDLPGLLAIVVEVPSGFLTPGFTDIEKFFVEFRMNEDWDAGFRPAASVVLIHYFKENHSYIMKPILWNKGDKFEFKEGEHFLKIEVLGINVRERTARISVQHSPISVPSTKYVKLPWEYLSPAIPLNPTGLGRDIAIVNERITCTPQWSLRPIVKSLADISFSYRFNNEASRRICQDALQTIIRIANEELNVLNSLEGPAPPPRDWSNQSLQPT